MVLLYNPARPLVEIKMTLIIFRQHIAKQIVSDLIFATSLCVIGVPTTINRAIIYNNPAVGRALLKRESLHGNKIEDAIF